MNEPLRWGVCATIRAPSRNILEFAAHHLSLGAHRVWIFLDTPAQEATNHLQAHPKCRVTTCDDAYWQRNFGRRPKKHQVRQSWNTTRVYARAQDVDWLLHIDVDEFLVPDTSVQSVLKRLPRGALTARVRPMEALAATPHHSGALAFKKFVPPGPLRQEIVSDLYPQFGPFLRGGFLSHVAGKVFLRTGLPNIDFRIHNVFQDSVKNPRPVDLAGLSLAHLHAPDWAHWRANFDFRLEKGAYRADLAPSQPAREGGQTLHACLSKLVASEGEDGLRSFFGEVVGDSEVLRSKLDAQGLLALVDLDLTRKRLTEFPESADDCATV